MPRLSKHRVKSRKGQKSRKTSRKTIRRSSLRNRSKRIGAGVTWVDIMKVNPNAKGKAGHLVKTWNGVAGTGSCMNGNGNIYSCPEYDATNVYNNIKS